MTREEAIREWTFRSKHIKRWLYEYGEEPSIRHYVELIDMAIEALQREEAEEKGYCHRIKPKEHFKNDAMQKLREIPRYLNGVKEKQITKISADAESVVRCKDCDRGFGSPVCPIQSKGWAINIDTFYCEWGERREP